MLEQQGQRHAAPPITTTRLPMNATTYHAVLRSAAAVFGSYLFAWGTSVCGIAVLVVLGVDFHEAEIGMLMLAILVFLAMFLWSFAVASLARVCLVLGGGGAAMIGLGLAFQRMLVN